MCSFLAEHLRGLTSRSRLPGAGVMAASHPWQFYAKVSASCFLLGAAMETFMLHTGFYEK